MISRTPNRVDTVFNIDFLLDIANRGDGIIDLGPITFIRPAGVVALLTTIERLTNRPQVPPITILMPWDSNVQNYLVTHGVFDAMREHIVFRGPQPEDVVTRRSHFRQMVPCTHFTNSNAVERLANEMEEKFRTEFFGYASILQTCNMVFSELAENVVYHADSGGGYVLAQQYNYHQGPVVEIAVADCGIGIRSSLRKNQHLSRVDADEDAIHLAISEGVSSLEDRNRGFGLHHIAGNVRTQRDRVMTIRSGNGILTLRGDGTISATNHPVEYQGTIVTFVIPCEST